MELKSAFFHFLLISACFSSAPSTSTTTPLMLPSGAITTSGAHNIADSIGLAVDSSLNFYSSSNTDWDHVYVFNNSGVYQRSITSNINWAKGVAFDSNDNLFIASSSNNSVNKYNSSGTLLSTITTNINQPYGVFVDSYNNVWVTNAGNNTVTKYDSSGTLLSTINTNLNQPRGINMVGNNIYVANGGDHTISIFNSSGAYTGQINNNLNSPDFLTTNSSGYLFVSNNIGNTISIFNNNTYISDVTSGIQYANGITFDSNGNFFAIDYYSRNIYKFVPSLLWTNTSTNASVSEPSITPIAANTTVSINSAVTNQNVTYGGDIQLITYTLTDTTSSGTLTLSGVISGSGGITKSGAGTLELTGANTYTGSTTVNAGTLNVSGSGTISNTVILSPNSNITYDATSTPGSISSLTYNMSDGGAGVSSGPVVTGTITNNSSSAITLPSSINIANDGTIVNGDFIKMPQGTNWTLVSGASSGDSSIAVDPTLTAGGSIVYGLDRTTNNTLKLKVLYNFFADSNATTAINHSSESLNAMNSMKGVADAETWHISPSENFREIASKFKSFVSRIRSFSGKQSLETKPAIFAAEPIKLQKGSFGVWFGALFNMGKNKQTDLVSASNDHQEGFVGGVEYRNEKRQNFLGLMLGATMGKSELKNNKDNNSKTKTGMFGIYFTKGIKEFEVEGTISSAFAKSDTERAAFVPTKLIVHGDVNSKTFQERVALGYKFKWKNEKTGTTSTSIKPYIGINAMQFYRGAFKENDGGVFSISRSKMSYKTYGGEFGVGLRKRVDLENAKSLKFTLDLKALHIFNNPKIEDRIYLQGAPVDGIAVQGASLSKTTWAPSFVAQYGSPNWKISLKGTVLIQNNRTSYSGLIRGSYFM